MQASEIRFLQKIQGTNIVTLQFEISQHRVTTSPDRKILPRRFSHVSRKPHERFPKQSSYAEVSGKRPVGRPRTRWLHYIEDLNCSRFGLRPSEMRTVSLDREVWALNVELPAQPSTNSGRRKKNCYFTSSENH